VSDDGLIAVFDSGVGGLSVWRHIVRQLPSEDTLYLADQAHVPYGHRSLSEVRQFCSEIGRFLLRQGATIIVIACNTASAAALKYLRDVFPQVPFVGMEPAVKPAVARTQIGAVGVLATEATFQGELFSSLLDRYAGDVDVITQVCPGLVDAVEAGALETAETEALLRTYLTPLLRAGIDQLVLGCTHYPFLLPTIDRVIEGRASIIDPAPAVARQTALVLAQTRGGARTGHVGRHRFYTTADVEVLRGMVLRLLPESGRAVEINRARWVGGQLFSRHPVSRRAILR